MFVCYLKIGYPNFCFLIGCEDRRSFEPFQKLYLLNLNLMLFHSRGDTVIILIDAPALSNAPSNYVPFLQAKN